MTREEAIEWFKQNPFYHNGHEPFIMAIQALKNEPKHGRWIAVENDIDYYPFMCSECHEMVIRKTNYCPRCGAKMDG